jgi:hypothetical protein
MRRLRRPEAGAVLEALAAIAAGVVLARLVAGPLRFDVLGISVSMRSVARPLIVAAVLLVVRLGFFMPPDRVANAFESVTRVVFGAVLCGGVLGWMSFLSMTCGGADSYGYVSAAERILYKAVVQEEPLTNVLPFAEAISATTPLGYTPSTQVPGASVPVYPLGLPALMAASIALAGRNGPFFVAPLMGLVLLGAVYVSALVLTRDRLVALLTTALTAVNPVVFTYAIQPMSDVPAAAFFAIALALLVRDPSRPWLAGAAGAVCLLIRPALAPAVVLLIAVPYLVHRRFHAPTAVAYAVPVACGITVQLLLQWHLYGHPLANGYADMGTLFSIDRAATNIRSHSYWAWRALGPIFAGATAIGFFAVSRSTRMIVAMVLIGVAAPHVVYRTFDHWETLRFLLPALVVLTIPAAAGVLTVCRQAAGSRAGLLLSSAVVLMIAAGWASWLREQAVFVMPEHETRYRLAGELVTHTTPPDAVILAALHSGSIRYYANRPSVNWERIPEGALPATIAALRGAAHPVYLLLDSDEERAMFEAKHGSLAAWLPGGQRRNVQLLEAPRAPLVR